MQDLVLGVPGLVAHFDAAQIFHPRYALYARYHQAQRIAVFGPQHFAIHRPGHHHIIERALHRDGAGH